MMLVEVLCNNDNNAREVNGHSMVYTMTTLMILLLLLVVAFIICQELVKGNANVNADEKLANIVGEIVEIPWILCVTMASFTVPGYQLLLVGNDEGWPVGCEEGVVGMLVGCPEGCVGCEDGCMLGWLEGLVG